MTSDRDAQEIARMIRANFDAFMAGDIATMRTMDHTDSTIWDLFEPKLFVGAAARERFRTNDRAQSQKRGKLTMTVDEPLTEVWGDTALARYTLHFSYEPPNATRAHVRITDVFRRIDGRWLRVHHHEGEVPTGIPPIAEPPPGNQ